MEFIYYVSSTEFRFYSKQQVRGNAFVITPQNPILRGQPEEVGSDHVYVNKCMMSRIANSIPLR